MSLVGCMIIIVEKVTVINYLKNGKSINPYNFSFLHKLFLPILKKE